MSENEVSCYATHLLIAYARKNGLGHITDGIAEPVEKLDNAHEWTTAETWTGLAVNIEKELGGTPGILVTVTNEIICSETKSIFPLLLRILPFHLLVNSITRFARSYSNRNLIVKVTPEGKNRWHYSVKRASPGHFSTQMCDFNRGAAFAYLAMKGYTDISVSEQCCIPRDNAETCTYIVTGTPPRSLLRRLGNRLFFFSRNCKAIISHLEENHRILHEQNKELLSMRDFYSHTMKSMNEAIVWLDAEGCITFANQAFSTLTTGRSETHDGIRFEKHLENAPMAARFKDLCTEARRHPSAPFDDEFIFLSDNGNRRVGATTVIWIPGEHFPAGFIISIRDITEKRGIERQLSAAEKRYRSLYEHSPAIIFAIGRQGTFLYANPAMSELSGFTESELKAMYLRDIVAPRADLDVDQLFTGLLASSTRFQELHFRTRNGGEKCMALNTYHLFDTNGGLSGVAGIGIDMTETKKLNEQLVRAQRMNLLGQLAGGLAHDFGNVITSINGFGRLIATKATDEKIRRYAKSIEKAGQRAHDLVKNLLAFSSNDATEASVFDVIPIIEEVCEIFEGAVQENVTIHTELSEYPLHIKGDPGKIHQCLLNVCMNSRDAIGEQSGTITLRALKAFRDGERVLIEVEDTGTGIQPEIIDRIFDPFFTTKPRHSGAGLGLSVVYGIITSHGGDILVNSRPGNGALVTINLPAALV